MEDWCLTGLAELAATARAVARLALMLLAALASIFVGYVALERVLPCV
jgi:hypothetical protein